MLRTCFTNSILKVSTVEIHKLFFSIFVFLVLSSPTLTKFYYIPAQDCPVIDMQKRMWVIEEIDIELESLITTVSKKNLLLALCDLSTIQKTYHQKPIPIMDLVTLEKYGIKLLCNDENWQNCNDQWYIYEHSLESLQWCYIRDTQKSFIPSFCADGMK